MKLLSSLQDIPELKKDTVHLRNQEELLRKVNKLIKDEYKNLQIVTDFDHTLTRHSLDNGDTVLTSFGKLVLWVLYLAANISNQTRFSSISNFPGMFRECPSVPQHYRDEDNRLSGIYKPIESDPVMKLEDKIKHMVDWYVAAHTLLK